MILTVILYFRHFRINLGFTLSLRSPTNLKGTAPCRDSETKHGI